MHVATSAQGIKSNGNNVGILAGYNKGNITNCSSSGKISGNDNVGGLIGLQEYVYTNSLILNGCSSSADVRGNDRIGGLVGYGINNIYNTYATGRVIGHQYVGGLIRLLEPGSYMITNSYATGEVEGEDAVGGVVGYGQISNSLAANAMVAGFSSVNRVSSGGGGYANYAWYNMVLPFQSEYGIAGQDISMEDMQSNNVFNWPTYAWNSWEGNSFQYFLTQSAPVSVANITTSIVQGVLRNPANKVSVYHNHERKADASVSGTNWSYNTSALNIGDTIQIVCYEANLRPSYPVNVIVGYDPTDPTLKELKADAVLVAGFDPATLVYNITVPYSQTTINLDALPTNPNASVDGTGIKNLDVGLNTFPVMVRSADNSNIKMYEVNVYRKNNDVSLSSVAVNGRNTVYNAATSTYSIAVGKSTDKITIAATTSDNNASVVGMVTDEPIAEGQTKSYTLTVTAEDNAGPKGTYFVEVTHLNRELGSDASIASVTVNGKATTFDNNLTYSVSFASNMNKVTVVVETNDENATVLESYTNKPVNEGKNTLSLTVVAEDGTEKVYTLTVYVVSSDASLKSVKVNGTNASFDGSSTCTITVDNSVDKISVVATTNHALASVVTGNVIDQDIAEGETKVFTVTVTAEDGTTKNYILKVTREKKNTTDIINNEQTKADVKVYPNPIEHGSCFYIDIGYLNSSEALIKVYSITGKLMHSQKSSGKVTTCDVNLPMGMYMIYVLNNNRQVITFKLIVTSPK